MLNSYIKTSHIFYIVLFKLIKLNNFDKRKKGVLINLISIKIFFSKTGQHFNL